MHTASANPAALAISRVLSWCAAPASAGTPITTMPPRKAAGWMSATPSQTFCRKATASALARGERAMSGLNPNAMRWPARSSGSNWLQVSTAMVPKATTIGSPVGGVRHSTQVAMEGRPPNRIGTAISGPSPTSRQYAT